MDKARAHVLISGRVQGVFFRDFTRRAAEEREILGWVMNTRDGRVEAVFEGEKEKIKDMIRWCHQGSPMSQVTGGSILVSLETSQSGIFISPDNS